MDINPYLVATRSIQCLQDLGDLGVTVSIVYGRIQNGDTCYSVDVMSKDGESFDQPYRAESFQQAVCIAANQSIKRGWISGCELLSNLVFGQP